MVEGAKPTNTPSPGFRWLHYLSLGVIILLIISVILGPGGGSHFPPSSWKSSGALEQERVIYMLLMDYAESHQGAYPTGTSSTEIFQKLVDENHMAPTGKTMREFLRDTTMGDSVKDTAIFCVDIPGKTPATSAVLKPENVAFDVTVPYGSGVPDELPVIFVTGFKVTYVPGGTAVPLPAFSDQIWMSVCYNNNSAYAVTKGWGGPEPGEPFMQPDGTVANFVRATFNPGGKKYVQLTPNGPLEP